MSGRPQIEAGVLGALLSGAPSRLAKRLDANPRIADGWKWEESSGQWTIETDSGERVQVAATGGVVSAKEQVSCTCLLSPRCFHVLAVAGVLEPQTESGAAAPETAAPCREEARGSTVTLAQAQSQAARLAWSVGARLLNAGAQASGAVLQGELLRAIHSARCEGLHRLSAAGLRVLRHIRQLREGAAVFSALELQYDFLDFLRLARVLATAEAGVHSDWLGVARRAYHPAGNLRLHGVFCEPVVASTGYGGVVSWVMTTEGRWLTFPDVMPGGLARALGAYDATLAVGDTSIVHRELCRGGLFVQDATASEDGRLGAGKGVKAVRAEGLGWELPALRERFAVEVEKQLERAEASFDEPPEVRDPGGAFLLLRVTVVAVCPAGLIVETGDASGSTALLLPPLSHPDLAYLDNLRRLAVAGLRCRALARRLERGSGLHLLAIAADTEAPSSEPGVSLPEDWKGLCNLGYDRLQGGHVGTGPAAPVVQRLISKDPLAMLERWLLRVLLGGSSGLPQAALPSLNRDATRLEKAMMPGAASCLLQVGRSAAGGAEMLAEAWLHAGTYQEASRRRIRAG